MSKKENENIERDSSSKIETDILFLTDKIRLVKEKIRKTPWYRIDIHLKLNKEIKDLEKEAAEIGKRLNRLRTRPVMEIVKRP